MKPAHRLKTRVRRAFPGDGIGATVVLTYLPFGGDVGSPSFAYFSAKQEK